ncbi:MAG: putative DNA binding domain-containing protein [Bacteroidales bacterium]|nr:putative DNA binding domain-containing protein [Bacteroidales bacterium]
MNLQESPNIDFYKSLIQDKTTMHSHFVFVKGSEFESNPVSMTRISKKICALANSGGAKVIFGIYPKRNRADHFDFVTDFNKSIDWIKHEIQSQIDAPIKDLDIKCIEIEPGKFIFEFDIPANNGQPHMFSDYKYYKWQKSKAVALDESEVRMLYGKLSACELEFLGVYNTNGLPVLSAGKYSSMSFYPKFLIRNAGNIVEKDYKIEISFPAKLHEESFQPLKALFIRHDGSHVVFGQKGNNPLFQQEISTMIEAKIAVNAENIDTFLKDYINITLYFSNGIKKHSLKLSDTLTYNGKQLSKTDFTNIKTITMSL